MAILEARNLSIAIPTEDGTVYAARNISFSVDSGELFGIAGESGSGKSVLMQAITGILPGAIVTGQALFEGRDLLKINRVEMRALRGAQIGMVFQDPLSSLHPYYTIGNQITETIHAHESTSNSKARARAVSMLERVGIADAAARFDDYPHQFSGGMRQRVMIAMALVLRPRLVIADEPTTALDVTVQAQIIALLDEMRRELGTTVIMITHDLGLLSNIADQIMVLYGGKRMEIGKAAPIFRAPSHPYTLGLLESSPASHDPGTDLTAIPGRPPSLLLRPAGCAFAARCPQAQSLCHQSPPPIRRYDDGVLSLCHFEVSLPVAEPLAPRIVAETALPTATDMVVIEDIHLTYTVNQGFFKNRKLKVLDGISLRLRRGETLGLVGESGCGKSTLARVIAGLVAPTAGSVTLDGIPQAGISPAAWREMRKKVQLVFQDPFGSLNPQRRIGSIIGDPFRIHRINSGAKRKAAVQELMEMVGLNPEHYNRFPSEFSGGQRQRLGIARALALKPSLIIFDEPVSALDVSIQAQILNLIRKLQVDLSLTYLFISHDLAVVRHVSDRIGVMNAGRIVELGTAAQIHDAPQDPFTRSLLAAMRHAPPLDMQSSRRLIETQAEDAT